MKTLLAVILAVATTLCGPSLLAQQPAPTDNLIRPAVQSEMLGLIPSFPVGNMARAVDFYVNKLGFAVILQSGANYTSVGKDLVQIGLSLDKSPQRVNKASAYINMSAIDMYYGDVKSRGVKLTNDLATKPSKMREFSLNDPDGNTLMFGEYVGQK